MQDEGGAPVSFDGWMSALASSSALTRKGRAVASVLRLQPRVAAYASTHDIARLAEVNAGTVVRAAQALGFSGWPDFQREFRSRLMQDLSGAAVADDVEEDSYAEASLALDLAAVRALSTPTVLAAVREVAQAIALARHVVVLAQGSNAAVGLALAHNCQLAGYDVRHVADAAVLANLLAGLISDDLLVVVNSWQVYESTERALAFTEREGIPSAAITGVGESELWTATWRIEVPSESAGFFPSLTGPLAVVQAVVVELSHVAPDRTRRAVDRAVTRWDELELLRGASRWAKR